MRGAVAESETLRVWAARRDFAAETAETGPVRLGELAALGGLSLIVWALVKLPAWFSWLDDWYCPRLTPIWVLGGLITLFLIRHVRNRQAPDLGAQLGPVIARFLPAYAGWSLAMVTLLPLGFGFE